MSKLDPKVLVQEIVTRQQRGSVIELFIDNDYVSATDITNQPRDGVSDEVWDAWQARAWYATAEAPIIFLSELAQHMGMKVRFA